MSSGADSYQSAHTDASEMTMDEIRGAIQGSINNPDNRDSGMSHYENNRDSDPFRAY